MYVRNAGKWEFRTAKWIGRNESGGKPSYTITSGMLYSFKGTLPVSTPEMPW